jgi:hypothetical protein
MGKTASPARDSLAQDMPTVAVGLPTPPDWSARGWRRTVGYGFSNEKAPFD